MSCEHCGERPCCPRVDAERARAEKAEAENTRLRAELNELDEMFQTLAHRIKQVDRGPG